MNLNDIIAAAKYEKTMRSISENNVSEILKDITSETLTEAEFLNVKYNKLAEDLREANYSARINDLMKDKRITPEEASKLHENIATAKKLTESTVVADLKEGYSCLSDIRSILDGDNNEVAKRISILENRRQAVSEYQPNTRFHHQNPAVQKYINGQINAKEKASGKDLTPEERAKEIHNRLKLMGKQQTKVMEALKEKAKKAKIDAEKKQIAKDAEENNSKSRPRIDRKYIERTEEYNAKHPEINKNKK